MNDPLQSYRRRFRRWRNAQRLRKERHYYQQKMHALGLHVPTEEEVGRLLRKKRPDLQAKEPGSLSILALYHHYNWENEALLPSLRQFGQVRLYDWGGEYDQQSKEWGRGLKERMNDELVSRVQKWIKSDQTDVIFCYLSGEIVYPATLRQITAYGVPMVNLALNDKEAFVGKIRGGWATGSRDICRFFDLCWTSTEDALEKYCVEGALPLYLPEGGNPAVHKPSSVEMDIDVSFVGQCYGNRPEVIEKVRAAGIKVEAYGFGWPNGPLTTEGMVHLYSRSRINLGFGGVDGLDATYCLKGRDFEVPMSGGLYLTEYHPELERCYRSGKEIVTYRGIDELIEKIKWLLEHPDEAAKIRQGGYQRAILEHTWEKRFAKVFGLMGVVRSNFVKTC